MIKILTAPMVLALSSLCVLAACGDDDKVPAVDSKPPVAQACHIIQIPTSAAAGAALALTVSITDAAGNAATGYAGTIRLTATDAHASLPGNATYDPAVDRGSHAFAVSLNTAGKQTLTATDVANPSITCTAMVAINTAAPQVVLTLPADANAGYAVSVGVALKDALGNAVTGFTGTVSFTSSDSGTGATAPATLTFTGSEGGAATTSATFATLGPQTLTATASGSVQATGTGTAQVHGLVYTSPDVGRVRLVVNAAHTTAQIAQLDLVANERLEIGSFFGGGPGSFAAGMNLPLDTTRVLADTALFAAGDALPLGDGVPAAAGVIGGDHVLYTAVSSKRVAGTITFFQSTEVQAGQVFYSVRLKLQSGGSVGPVFDGAQLGTLYRASVRDQFGDDFVGQADIGVGRLEIR